MEAFALCCRRGRGITCIFVAASNLEPPSPTMGMGLVVPVQTTQEPMPGTVPVPWSHVGTICAFLELSGRCLQLIEASTLSFIKRCFRFIASVQIGF